MDNPSVFLSPTNKLEPLISGIEFLNINGEEFYSISHNASIENIASDTNSGYKEFVAPDEILAEKIVTQVEHLFSDFYILKDKFLLKHIRRNKEGFVSLKLISSLRKVKALTKDWRVVAYSLQRSKKLEMNDEKTKVKRIAPLPDIEGTGDGRTVIAFNLPLTMTEEDVKKLFLKYGVIASVSLMKIDNGSRHNYLKKCLSYYQDMSTSNCAIVEFETVDGAVRSLRYDPQLALMVVPLPIQRNKCNADYKSNLSPQDMQKLRFEDDVHMPDMILSHESNPKNNFTSDSQKSILNLEQPNNNSTKYLKFCKKSESELTPRTDDEQLMLSCTYQGDGLANNLWKQRRQYIMSHGKRLNRSRVVVIRQPRGPDGTNGFHRSTRRIAVKN
ncbi:la-related protein 6-like [Stegodyphus dumicola]|uniref:la-related protein 6-like n=1 Tax=Stegodyphus dumicola TaxID=202533 RepID=UPI0015AB80AA|nr:la-related protein 6-like [Stegodyphus dumicola]